MVAQWLAAYQFDGDIVIQFLQTLFEGIQFYVDAHTMVPEVALKGYDLFIGFVRYNSVEGVLHVFLEVFVFSHLAHVRWQQILEQWVYLLTVRQVLGDQH